MKPNDSDEQNQMNNNNSNGYHNSMDTAGQGGDI